MPAASSKNNLGRYGLEAVMIVFSVLLALFFDQILEERREARMIDELLGYVADEMQRNLAIADEWLPYHQGAVAKTDRYLASEELQQSLLTTDGIDYGRMMERGLIQDFYSSASWQLAQQTELTSQLDFEITQMMSEAYSSQQNVNRTLDRFSDFFFDRATHDPAELAVSLRIYRMLLSELAGQESVLQDKYRLALDRIDQ